MIANIKNTELYFKYSESKSDLKTTKKSVFKIDINEIQNQHINARVKKYKNKDASTWISAIYGRQNALQESLCEGVWRNQLFLQDREESGTGSYRELCTHT